MYKFLSARRLDFDTKDGEHLDGYTFWFGEEKDDIEEAGLCPFKMFFRRSEGEAFLKETFGTIKLRDLQDYVGRPCDMTFDRRGKPQTVVFE